jgi:hypothetical protein
VISFRHHIVSLVAVFLALAVGVVLGAGPLSDVGAAADGPTTTASTDPAEQAAASYSDDFVEASTPQLVESALADRSVTLVTLPGADEQAVSALEELVGTAGGTTTGRYALTQTMLEPGEKALVDTLGSQLAEQQQDGVVDADATTYERIGQLLGRAIATGGGGEATASASVLEGMQGAGLVTLPKDAGTRAPLVLVVLGDPPEGEGADAIAAGISQGLAAAARGVVVAGTVSDGGEGQLARLRDGDAAGVTTVDGIDTAAGRVAAVLSLARAESGGAFGASGEDGPAPLR